jgi:hypothetical protein
MPHYYKLQGPWTISPGATVGFSLTWANTGGSSDHGPIVPMANPRSAGGRQVAKLTTLDVTKGRTGGHHSSVFYEFKIRNEGNRIVSFDVELVDFHDLM